MKRHQIEPVRIGTWVSREGFMCDVCGRRIRQGQRFMLMRDESGASLGTTEMKTVWRHRPQGRAHL